MMQRRAAAALPIALGIFLLGSAGCGGRSVTPRFYVLAPIAAPAASAPDSRPGAIGVGPVRLPAYVDRSEIVTRRAPEEIELAEFDRWGEPLADSVPRTIGDNLAVLLPGERIAVFPWTASRSIRYQVVIDIARFDGSLGGAVVLDARWRIIGPERRDLADRRFTISEPSGAPTYSALVAAMSRALGAISRDIAGALTGL